MREHWLCSKLYFNCASIYLHPTVKDVSSNFLSLWMENLLQLQKKHSAPTLFPFPDLAGVHLQ